MKKSQFLIATLCMSALVLSACTIGSTTKKKKKKSSSSDITSVTSSGDPTSAPTSGPTSAPTSAPSSGSSTPAPTSGSSTSPVPVKTLVSIAVTTAPTKTVYYAGETFDPTGMVVTATYSDSSTDNVTSGCTFAPSPLTEGTTSVTISYQGKTATQAVTVKAPAPTAWSTAEMELLNTYLNEKGSDVPFVYVEGSSLSRSEESAAIYYGGSEEIKDEQFVIDYVSKFDSGWNIEKDEESIYAWLGMVIYSGSKVYNEGASNEYTVYVEISLDGDWTAEDFDGSGAFEMYLYDDYYYSWAEFSSQYEKVLTYFYDTYDEEEEEYVDFPAADVINFTGDLDYVYMEPKYEDEEDPDSEILYCDIYLFGVSQEDWTSFLADFYESEAWTRYENKLSGMMAYYHSSEKLTIDYHYYSSDEVGRIIIEPYEKIYNVWPGTEIASFVHGINEGATLAVPEFDADYYLFDEHPEDGLGAAYAFDKVVVDPETEEESVVSLTQDDVDTYVEGLDSEYWFYDKIFEEDAQGNPTEDYYYVVFSKDHSINLQVVYFTYSNSEGGYAGIFVIPNAPLESSFDAAAVTKFYSDNGVTVENLPSYVVEAASGGFIKESASYAIEFEIFDSTSAEFDTFKSQLAANGWVLDEQESDASKNYYCYNYGESIAKVELYQYNEVEGSHCIYVHFGFSAWPSAMEAKFSEELHGVVPPYFEADITFVEDEKNGNYFYFFGGDGSANTALRNAYFAFVGDATWVQEGSYVSFSKEAEDGGTVEAYWSTNGNFYICYEEPAPTDWTEEQALAFETNLHFVPKFNDYTKGLTWYQDAYYENVVTTQDGLIAYLETEGFVENKDAAYTDSDGDPHVIYEKSIADPAGKVVFDICEYEGLSGTTIYVKAYFESGSPVPPTPGEPVTIDTTVEALATTLEWTADTVHKSFNLDEKITVTASEGTNNGKYFVATTGAHQYRLFGSESGTMTISAPDGYVITSITLTFSYQNGGTLSYDGNAITSGTAVEINAQSATFTVGGSTSSGQGKIFITNFVVTYAPVSA